MNISAIHNFVKKKMKFEKKQKKIVLMSAFSSLIVSENIRLLIESLLTHIMKSPIAQQAIKSMYMVVEKKEKKIAYQLMSQPRVSFPL